MDFKEFFNKRRIAYYKKLANYMKYVFNDFFLLFLFILLGALLYNYSSFLEELTDQHKYLSLVMMVILSVLPFFGKFQSLIEPADKVFIAPIEKGLDGVMNEQRNFSLITPGIIYAFITALMMPIFVYYGWLKFPEWIILFLTTIMLKVQDLFVRQSRYRAWEEHWFVDNTFMRWVTYLAIFFVTIFLSTWFGAIISIILTVLSASIYNAKFENYRWNFMTLIDDENKRMSQLTRTINLFTDVKGIKEAPKRLKFLDPLINIFSHNKINPYQYLYTRAFFRQTTYLNLYIRLTIIGALIIAFTQSTVWTSVFGAIFIYLTAFQLLPIANVYDRNSLIAVYPTNKNDRINGIQNLLIKLLLIESIVFTLASFVQFDIMKVVINAGVFILTSLVFVYVYAPIKLRTRKKIR